MDDTAAANIDLDKFDFFTPQNLADPYAILKRLRRERPVAKFFQIAKYGMSIPSTTVS